MPIVPREEDVDPTLATERTSLAWNRTALALGAIGGLGLKIGIEGRVPYLSFTLGALVLLVAVWTFLYGLASYRANRTAMGRGRIVPHTTALRVFAYGITAVAGIAFALALIA